jgi:hypothetical protein
VMVSPATARKDWLAGLRVPVDGRGVGDADVGAVEDGTTTDGSVLGDGVSVGVGAVVTGSMGTGVGVASTTRTPGSLGDGLTSAET